MKELKRTSAERSVPVRQAIEHSPDLGLLLQRASRSRELLALARCAIPESLRPHVEAGPVQGQELCLLAKHPAAAAKLRQLVPALETLLHAHATEIRKIRIKVVTA